MSLTLQISSGAYGLLVWVQPHELRHDMGRGFQSALDCAIMNNGKDQT